ncbi:MAG: gamma-glutamyltransferase [Solirubrobacterales bacterium]
MSRGVVAGGHPATAEAGAWALREGGNAADAAIAAVLASVVTESPLTGLGAGGFMLVHTPGGDATLLDFFVSAGGLGGARRAAELEPVEIDFGDTTQVFNVGPASCGVPGVPSGLATAAERYGSMPLADLVAPAVGLARDGFEITTQHAYLFEILAPILAREPAGAAVYAPAGRMLGEGERMVFPELAETLERLGADGPAPFYDGDIAAAIAATVAAGGGTLGKRDLATYETVVRDPVRAGYGACEILTNPPPSSGGVLIAYALELLTLAGGATDPVSVVTAMESAQQARTREFLEGLYEPGFADRFLADRLGSTTHITALDGEGGCASVTCSNGSGSGVFVPGTGIQLNNMLGEEDLNPFGFHATRPGRRMPSMMSPTIALRDGELILGLGSGGSNRIRSAVSQTILRYLGDGLDLDAAVKAPRLHYEAGIVHAEPGIDPEALARLELAGHRVIRWRAPNLFFGGVHAVGAGHGRPEAAGDPRRGGAVAYA